MAPHAAANVRDECGAWTSDRPAKNDAKDAPNRAVSGMANSANPAECP